MLKIVVFDCGYGGELFADQLESELPVVNVIRVIDWRNSETILTQPKKARLVAENALKPYLGKVDLIIIANYSISTTSLNYFRRKYKNQKFVGLSLKSRRMLVKRSTLILTTTATTKSLTFFTLAMRTGAKTICLDSWPPMIDAGTLTNDNIESSLVSALGELRDFSPEQILLFCSQFSLFIPKFRKFFGHNTRIVDSFDDAIRDTYKILHLKGLPKQK